MRECVRACQMLMCDVLLCVVESVPERDAGGSVSLSVLSASRDAAHTVCEGAVAAHQ